MEGKDGLRRFGTVLEVPGFQGCPEEIRQKIPVIWLCPLLELNLGPVKPGKSWKHFILAWDLEPNPILCRMGPPIAFSCLVSGWTLWFMDVYGRYNSDLTIVNGGYFMVYEATSNWIPPLYPHPSRSMRRRAEKPWSWTWKPAIPMRRTFLMWESNGGRFQEYTADFTQMRFKPWLSRDQLDKTMCGVACWTRKMKFVHFEHFKLVESSMWIAAVVSKRDCVHQIWRSQICLRPQTGSFEEFNSLRFRSTS